MVIHLTGRRCLIKLFVFNNMPNELLLRQTDTCTEPAVLYNLYPCSTVATVYEATRGPCQYQFWPSLNLHRSHCSFILYDSMGNSFWKATVTHTHISIKIPLHERIYKVGEVGVGARVKPKESAEVQQGGTTNPLQGVTDIPIGGSHSLHSSASPCVAIWYRSV